MSFAREQAVRLQALIKDPLKALVVACGEALGDLVGSIKPTEWREACQQFLRKHPAANISTQFLIGDFSRYAGKQLVVIFAHLRRLCQNPVKVQNALATLPQDQRAQGRAFIDQIRGFRSTAGKRSPKKKKKKHGKVARASSSAAGRTRAIKTKVEQQPEQDGDPDADQDGDPDADQDGEQDDGDQDAEQDDGDPDAGPR